MRLLIDLRPLIEHIDRNRLVVAPDCGSRASFFRIGRGKITCNVSSGSISLTLYTPSLTHQRGFKSSRPTKIGL